MRELVGFDSEDDSNGNPSLFVFVHERGFFHAVNRHDALNMLESFRDHGEEPIEVWATNLEYDLVNLFGPERLKEVEFTFGKSFLVSATWRKIEFRDTVRHIPSSVRELGEMVGLPKLENDGSMEYCVRDAAITYRAAKMLYEIYEPFGVKPSRTLAATALKIWKQNYWKEAYPSVSSDVWEASKEAYYGGRVEPFYIGSLNCNIRAIDVSSMYPYCMLGEFPDCKRIIRMKGNLADTALLTNEAICKAEVHIDVSLGGIPPLPFRSCEGLVFPNGKFVGSYTSEELNYAKSLGHKVRVLEAHIPVGYPCRPYEEYVREMYKGKQTARGSKRLGYKLLLNSLYGKFGQTGDKVNVIPLERLLDFAPRYMPDDFKVWNGLALYMTEEKPPAWSNMIWPSIVTARARIHLHKEMTKLHGRGNVIAYCDTDSIIYSEYNGYSYPKVAREMGQFEKRGEFKSIFIAGKKEYGLEYPNGEWEIHVKGVPFSARAEYLTNGTASFMLPNRLRASIRRGLTANKWEPRIKSRRKSYLSRLRGKADGPLDPPTAK